MTQLPAAFTNETRQLLGDERYECYMQSFGQPAPVSIRLNPMKAAGLAVADGERVPWCSSGWYLPRRPNFTMDPLLHAGCYYVQEAASMFICHVLQQYVDRPVSMLDLCAAPGGKSTAAIATLPAGSTLYSNEPVHRRFSILEENVAKWGYPNHFTTCRYPRDFSTRFDVILCDAPCSGEGMFRKDPATIAEWNTQNVGRCAALQRSIVGDIWPCLADGGLFIYSTCTFNLQENEENVCWMLSRFGAELLPVAVSADWHITGSLLPGFDGPVYRFIPGISRGEGLFMAIMRKQGNSRPAPVSPSKAIPHPLPTAELSYPQAISYLRGEALVLPPDIPHGEVTVTFLGHPLGTVKNIGSRANNLYPKPWRIKTTHIPTDYEAILRHT